MVLRRGRPFHLLRLCPEALSVLVLEGGLEECLFTRLTYYGLLGVGEVDICLWVPTVLGNASEVGHFCAQQIKY
jgi:hypothetical protein